MVDLTDLILNSVVAIAAALLGAAVGYALSRRSAEKALRSERERTARRAMALLMIRVNDAVSSAQRLPASASDITDPEIQLTIAAPAGSADDNVRVMMDLPSPVFDAFSNLVEHVVTLNSLTTAARGRAARILGAPAPPLFLNSRTWTAADASDSEFFHLYERVLKEREELLKSLEPLKEAVSAAIPKGSVFG